MLSPAPANISLLVVLEALLFLNFPVWERVTAYASPDDFGLQLGFAAIAATVICHVGPATLAAHWRPPQWLSSGLDLWIILGNLLVIGLLAFRLDYPAGLIILGILVAAGIAPLRRVLALLFLACGLVLLLWALYDKREGLGYWTVPNGHMPRMQWGGELILELLLAAAPALPLAWMIGRRTAERKTIWLTGLSGVGLPLSFSCATAMAALNAGWELHARSKLYLGFTWALLPPAGLEEWYFAAINLSTAWPMLPAAIVIQELLPPGHRLLHTLWPAALAAMLGYIGAHSHWEGNADRAWALSLLFLGLLSPIAYFAWRRKYRT